MKYTPQLDTELTEAGQRFLETRSVIVRGSEEDEAEVAVALGHLVSDPEDALILRLHRDRHPNLMHIMNLFSLYVFPAQSWNSGTLTVASSLTGEQVEQEYFAGRWFGLLTWLCLFSPGWEIDQNGGEVRRDSERAYYTLINRLAAEKEAKDDS